MPKRSAQEKIKVYKSKLRKLEDRQYRFRRLVILSSSEDEESSGNDTSHDPPAAACSAPTPAIPILDPTPCILDPTPEQDTAFSESSAQPLLLEPQGEPELGPELLLALGDATDDTPKFGDNINSNLAQRWLPILKKGLPKETKDNLLKDYLIPENCPLLLAPKLNVEIAAAVMESVRIRDKKMETTQHQLGVGITAVNRAMTLLLTSDDKIQPIKLLSDGCRLLSDLHFSKTQTRIKLVTPGLARPFLNVLQESDRDDTLFGNKLSDKIKASKVIQKQGLQIKKPVINNIKPTAASFQPSTSRAPTRYQGNWTGPSRYSTSRGGRGAPRRPPTSRRPPPPAQVPTARAAGYGKPRAPAQQ